MADSFIELDYIPDYAQRMIDNIMSRYRGKPRVEALYGAIGDGIQVLEDLIFDVIVSTLLDNAEGVWLDNWGDLINISRDGFSDVEYRRFIKAGILIRLSSGRPHEISTIYSKLTEATTIRWYKHYNRGFQIEAYRPEFMSEKEARKVKRLMKRTQPAVLDWSLVEVTTDPSTSGTGFSKARVL